jgi:hypothetical protein
MANNYCESSSKLVLSEDKIEKAREIVLRVEAEFEENPNEGYFGASVFVEDDGVWICHDESVNPDHVETLVGRLLEELEIDEPFVFSWSYTCSKPRLDEFGGGACVVQRGQPSMWFDARSLAENYVRDGIDIYKPKELLEALEQILDADGDLYAMDFDQARAAIDGARRKPRASN